MCTCIAGVLFMNAPCTLSKKGLFGLYHINLPQHKVINCTNFKKGRATILHATLKVSLPNTFKGTHGIVSRHLRMVQAKRHLITNSKQHFA
jgi:hypothetical protein